MQDAGDVADVSWFFRTKCPTSFPLSGWIPQRETSAIHRFIRNLLCGFWCQAPNPWASASLFGTMLGSASPSAVPYKAVPWSAGAPVITDRNILDSWHVIQGSPFTHFSFFCAGGRQRDVMGCHGMSDDGCCCKTLYGHMLNLGVGVSWCLHRHTGWLPGYSAFSRRSTSARRLLRSGVEVGTRWDQ